MPMRLGIVGELQREGRCCSGGGGLTRHALACPCSGCTAWICGAPTKPRAMEKLCFSLECPLGSGSPKGVVKAGAAELVEKGPLVPTLPFPLRKPRKAHKYLRLSRKKFPPRGPHLESHRHRQELSLQESAAPDVLQTTGDWEPMEQPPEEEGKAVIRRPQSREGPPPLSRGPGNPTVEQAGLIGPGPCPSCY